MSVERKMERVSFIECKGKRILLEDFSRMSPGKEFSRTIAKAQCYSNKFP